jgi:anti-sigma B factor antagonist
MAQKKYPAPHSIGGIQAACSNQQTYFRVSGLANMEVANPLEAFSNSVLKQGYRTFYVDLEDCHGMDSTFMGVLIGIATYDDHVHPPSVKVLHANSHNIKLMKALGVTEVVEVVTKKRDLSKPLRTCSLVDLKSSSENKISLIWKAHENLAKLSKSNREKFEPFFELLSKEYLES